MQPTILNRNITRKRIIIFLMLIIAIVLTSCNVSSGNAKTIYIETPENKKQDVFDLSASARNGILAASDKEKEALNNEMKLQAENKYIALYLGKYADIAVLDKETGSIWFSNPDIYGLNKTVPFSEEAKSKVYSALAVHYYTKDYSATVSTLSVYPDGLDSENSPKIAFKNLEDGLEVTYTLGKRPEDLVYYSSMTQKTFDKILLEIDELAKSGKISYSLYGLFEQSYDPPGYSDSEFYSMRNTVSDLDIDRLSELFYTLGITKKDVDEESKITGIKFSVSDSPWFVIPVSFRLSGRDLTVSIDTTKIKNNSNYYLNHITTLEMFGAAPKGAEGYLFVPNGSGMLIGNDSDEGNVSQMSVDFYSSDYGKILSQSSDLSAESIFPIFGVKNGNRALFGIVESGDAMAGMTAAISDSYADSNRAFPYFICRPFDKAKVDVQSKISSRMLFSKTTAQTTFRTRYHFLYDTQASYTGMAKYYQRYLEQSGVISPIEKVQPFLTLETLGSVKKKTMRFGIPVTIDQPLTTFEQTQNLVAQLTENGVNSIDLITSGVMNGGLDHEAFYTADFQKELGGSAGYENLLSAMKKSGNRTSTTANFSTVYRKGNGFKSSSHAIRALSKEFVSIGKYHPSTGFRDQQKLAYLVSPLYYTEMVSSFLKDFKKVSSKSLYIEDIGNILAADYNENREILREQSKHYAIHAVRQIADAGYEITLDKGNGYLIPFADKLINVDLSTQHYKIEKHSVPFVSLVLHGYLNYTGKALNLEANQDQALLKTIENGAGIYYKIMAEDTTALLNTQHTDLSSTYANLWISEIEKQYKELQPLFEATALQRMIGHEFLADEVTKTIYENGVQVIVNYSNELYSAQGVTVEAGGFLALGVEG